MADAADLKSAGSDTVRVRLPPRPPLLLIPEKIKLMIQHINSQKDPLIATLRRLQSIEGRAKENRYFADGETLVTRAFSFGADIESLILTDKFLKSSKSLELAQHAANINIPVFACTSGLLSKIIDAKPSAECVCIIRRKHHTIENVLAHGSFIVMVENGENADNIGMLLRSTDAAGVDGVIFAGECVDPFGRRVVRGSRGAAYTVPIAECSSSIEVIKKAKELGYQVIATSANTDMFYDCVDYKKRTMLIVGNEHIGISEIVRDSADGVVKIPMFGKVNSLNIAVAASVMMYEIQRQRKA